MSIKFLYSRELLRNLEDLDSGYVEWLGKQEWLKPELKRTFEHLGRVGNLLV